MEHENITWKQLLQPEDYKFPEELLAKLEPDEEDQKENDDQEDRFNDRGKNIVRDNSNHVTGTEEIVEKINIYRYEPDSLGRILYYCTCCMHYLYSRRVIPDGYFGHYISSERHMLVTPGVRRLGSCSDQWAENIPIDDQSQRKNHVHHAHVESWGRKLGSKYLVNIPENHLGGAYRIGKPKGNSEHAVDGEFVLFKVGRHVLDSFAYKDIQMTNLERAEDQDMVTLGPITILYLKEGYLGGAHDVWAGIFRMFYPGAPLLLHRQDFKNIQSVKTSLDPYKLGPYTFVTVQEGYLAGAYNKTTGVYQILKEGNTYWLHEKDWDFDEGKDLVPIEEQFSLGPYIYQTVKEGNVAGAYHKKSGKFIELPEGKTYRLNEEDFLQPIVVKKDTHRVVCGPITYLAVEDGTLNGAYRLDNGNFEEFDDPDKEYVLHEKKYRGIITIPKYTSEEQQFGVYKVITIPEGSNGIFEREGHIEVKGPGFYKLTAEYRILPMMSVNTFTMTIESLNFKTKDGTMMAVNASMVWFVTKPELTSVLTPNASVVSRDNPSFETVKLIMKQRLQYCLIKQIQKYNRDALLPTKQDIALKHKNITGDELDEVLKQASAKTEELYGVIEQDIKQQMDAAADESMWGTDIDSIKLEGFELKDESIQTVLDQITEAIIAINREKVNGDFSLAEEEQNKQRKIKETEMQSSVKIEKAKADTLVGIEEAKAAADVKKTRAEANSNDAISKAKTENAAKVSLAKDREQAVSDARNIKLDIKNQETLSAAKAEAEAIEHLAKAKYDQLLKNYEAVEKMSDKQYNLKMSEKSIRAMNALSGAAWRMPNKVLEFYNQFDGMLKPQ